MKLYIVCYLLSLLTQCLYGANDHQSWTKVSLEKKTPYPLKLELSQGLRLKDQLSTFNQTFFEASLSYKDSNGLRINIPYRYTIFENKIKHRLSFGASYQYSFKPVSLKYRMKYYRLYENGEPIGEDGEALGDLIRSKFTIKYKSGKKTNPYISGELFHLLNTNNNPLNEYRASFGIEIDLPRKNSINIFYIFKKEDITKSSTNERNVFGLSYISKI
jgi:hypothetical protein